MWALHDYLIAQGESSIPFTLDSDSRNPFGPELGEPYSGSCWAVTSPEIVQESLNFWSLKVKLRLNASPALIWDAHALEKVPFEFGSVRTTDKGRVPMQTLAHGFSMRRYETQQREIDLAIIPLENKPPARLRYQRLLHLPLVLLVHRKSKWKSAAALWAQGTIEEPLICLPP